MLVYLALHRFAIGKTRQREIIFYPLELYFPFLSQNEIVVRSSSHVYHIIQLKSNRFMKIYLKKNLHLLCAYFEKKNTLMLLVIKVLEVFYDWSE